MNDGGLQERTSRRHDTQTEQVAILNLFGFLLGLMIFLQNLYTIHNDRLQNLLFLQNLYTTHNNKLQNLIFLPNLYTAHNYKLQNLILLHDNKLQNLIILRNLFITHSKLQNQLLIVLPSQMTRGTCLSLA